MDGTPRLGPNILITGTPGTGKTATAAMVAEATNLRHINVGDWVKKQELHSGYDTEFDSYIIDEDKVLPPCMHMTEGRLLHRLTAQSCSTSRACHLILGCFLAAYVMACHSMYACLVQWVCLAAPCMHCVLCACRSVTPWRIRWRRATIW